MNLGEPSSLFEFEEVIRILHNNQGPPPVGPSPPQNNNGPPLVVRPNGLAPQSMEELSQAFVNERGRPIAPIPIQATDLDFDTINAATGGTFMQKTPKECYDLIENMSTHHNHWDTSETQDELSRSISSTITTESPEVVRQLELMNKNFQEMMRQMQPVKVVNTKCETCGGPHSYTDCPAVGGYTQEAAYATIGSGSLPCNTIANPRGDVKAITTQSDVAYDGPMISPTLSPLPKVVEHETEETKDEVQATSLESTAHFQPPAVQVLISEPIVAPKPNTKPSIPYPSRLNDQKLREKTNSQMLKFLQIFQRLHFDLSFANALLHIPKFASMFKRFKSCMALVDLGASINLMPLSVWKKLSLLNLTSTRITLELATRSYAYPAGIAEDVFMQVGKFTFPADFVVVEYDVDPYIPLILGRPFLRMARALVDVHGEELILRDGDEQLIFHADSTSKHPHKHGNESINMINFINITCEDCFPKVLKLKKSSHPSSGSTTPLSDSSPSLTPFETSDSLLEEFVDRLALLDPFPLGKEDNNFDFRADLREIEYLQNQDPSTESNIKTIDLILEKFTNEPSLDYLPPPRDDDDDLFDLKSDRMKKLLYGDCYKDINFEKDKNKDSKMKSLVVEAHIVKSNDLLLQLLDKDSTLLEESSESYENASLSLSPFENKDKVFNPCILILGGTQILKDESKDKDLILEDCNFLSISSDKELFLFLELTVIETLLSFSFENKDKVFNPEILISNGVHSFILELYHQTYETFKIIIIHQNIFNEGPMKIFPFSVSTQRKKEFEESQARDSHKNKRFSGRKPVFLFFLFQFSNKCDARRLSSSFLMFCDLCFLSRIALDYEDSRARGFVHRLLELQSLECLYMGIQYPRSYCLTFIY
nr:hypothetical protein [Tanacetum cinerariifolium]